MRYLLDTNALSDYRRRRSASLVSWFERQAIDNLALSVITVVEMERGILRLQRRDVAAALRIRDWFEQKILADLADRVLPVDERTARIAVPFHVPDPMPEFDALIAATAIRHDLTLVSRNRRDMERTGVRLLDPWGPG